MTRLLIWSAVAAAALAGSGCAATRAGSYVERSVNFAQYRTYDWTPPDALPAGDPRLAEKARPIYDRFYQIDVDGFEFPERHEYDLIIFADVLEHLADPAAILRRCFASLKDDGMIIISVPNVANIVVRLSLLFGRFDYGDRGILDRTHLRFFTLKSLTDMLEQCGLKIGRIVATPIPVQLVWPVTNRRFFAPLHDCHFLLVRLCKTLFAYQFVVQADGGGSRAR